MKDINYYMNLRYPIEIQEIPPEFGGGYDASIPMLGRYAFHGWGNTIEEAIEMLNEIKKELFEEYIRKGISIPEPPPAGEPLEKYSGKFLVRVPKSLHRKLAEIAEKEGVSLNQYVLELLASGLVCSMVRTDLENVLADLSQTVGQITFRLPSPRPVPPHWERRAETQKEEETSIAEAEAA